MKISSSSAAIVLVAAGALAAAGCGGADKPAGAPASSAATPVETTSRPPAEATVRGTGVDRAFVAAMLPHHRSGIAMARIARRQGTSTFVERLARDIVSSQTRAISMMRREDTALELAGIKRGSLGLPAPADDSRSAARALKAARPFDAAFLRMIVVHHRGAIAIARVQDSRGRDPQLRRLASQIITAHQREIGEIRKQFGKPAVGGRRPAPPIGKRDPRQGSPDMPGVDDTAGLPTRTK